MLNTGLVSVTFRDKTPEEIISTVKQCGLEGIEWGGSCFAGRRFACA